MTLHSTPLTAALALLALAIGPACVTETIEGDAPTGLRTEGVIVSGPVEEVWGHTEAVIAAMATGPLTTRGLEHSLRTEVRGQEVEAFVEPYDSQRTVLHVTSEDPALADRIRLEVMRP
ncbi:MAG: hypothetical protein AAF726_17760 [Planctomycetota bacterium]